MPAGALCFEKSANGNVGRRKIKNKAKRQKMNGKPAICFEMSPNGATWYITLEGENREEKERERKRRKYPTHRQN